LGCCIVCHVILFLWTVVLFVLLSFFFGMLHCLSFCPF
jgi:hypothetical protein